jgi:hypothetical protein
MFEGKIADDVKKLHYIMTVTGKLSKFHVFGMKNINIGYS